MTGRSGTASRLGLAADKMEIQEIAELQHTLASLQKGLISNSSNILLLADVVVTEGVLKLLQWFEDLEILFLESSEVPFKKKCSFSCHC